MGVIIAPEDKRFYVQKPDPSFNPTRNKQVIEETIRETTQFFTTINKAFSDEVSRRAEIVSDYGNYRLNMGGEKTAEQYLGKRLMSELIGEKILSKVRVLEASNKMSGRKDKFIQL